MLRKNLPRTYARLAQYSPPFQSRRSQLIWKIYGRRRDGSGLVAAYPGPREASVPLMYASTSAICWGVWRVSGWPVSGSCG